LMPPCASRQSRRRRARGCGRVCRVDRAVAVSVAVAVDVNVNITSPPPLPCPWPSPRLWLHLWPLMSTPPWPSLCPSRRSCRRCIGGCACGCQRHLAAQDRCRSCHPTDLKSLKQASGEQPVSLLAVLFKESVAKLVRIMYGQRRRSRRLCRRRVAGVG
jgi:hypothetical protein